MNQKIIHCLFLGFLFLWGCQEEKISHQEDIRTVKVFHVRGPSEILERSLPGKVEASTKADLSFLVPGKIIEFSVKEGDKVEKDQVIARLDPKDFEIAVEEAKAKVDFAEVQLERKAKLLEKDFVSKSEYDAQKATYEVANANYDTAKQNLAYTSLLAPFSGEISAKYVENFQTVKAKEPIVNLHNRNNIDVIVQVPESLAIHFNQGMKAQLDAEFDSAPGVRYPVTIKELSSKPSIDTQTYKLTLTMVTPQNVNILPGMTATIYAKIVVKEGKKEREYKVPLDAVFADEKNQSYVWVISPTTQRIKKHPIKLGRLEKDGVIVTEGIVSGMNIVAAGAKFLNEDEKVRPFNLEKE